MNKIIDKKVAKLRHLADSMQAAIDKYRNPAVSHQNLTRRRASIASNMAATADNMEKVQQVLRGLAKDIEEENLPSLLEGISTKAQVESLMNTSFPKPYINKHSVRDLVRELEGKENTKDVIEGVNFLQSRESDYLSDASEIEAVDKLLLAAKKHGIKTKFLSVKEYTRLVDVGIKNEDDFKEAKDYIKQYLIGSSTEQKLTRELKALEADLIGQKIPGFFPTPRPTIEKMLDKADIEPYMSVLEPSAGKGDIVQGIVDRFKPRAMELPGTQAHPQIDAIECNDRLVKILGYKATVWASDASGYAHHVNIELADFLQINRKYDRIILNPPFEQGQDIEHVRHAYDLLKPGGRVVAIMSEGSFCRDDKKAKDFRDWLCSVGGESERLEAGSFTGKDAFRQTGVATRLVWIDKEE